MADYPDTRGDIRTSPPGIRPTPVTGGPQPSTSINMSQRSMAGPAIAAAAVVIVVALAAWAMLGGRETPVAPVPVSETTAPATTEPGAVPAPTPPQAAPEADPVPDTTPGIVPEGDPAPDTPEVGDPPSSPGTGTGTPGATVAPSN